MQRLVIAEFTQSAPYRNPKLQLMRDSCVLEYSGIKVPASLHISDVVNQDDRVSASLVIRCTMEPANESLRSLRGASCHQSKCLPVGHSDFDAEPLPTRYIIALRSSRHSYFLIAALPQKIQIARFPLNKLARPRRSSRTRALQLHLLQQAYNTRALLIPFV
jgi:hypothetical protein